MRRGVGAVFAVVGFLVCAPAWAGTEAGVAVPSAAVMGRLPASAVGHLTASARQASTTRTVRAANATRPPRGRLALTPASLTYHGGHMKLSWSGSNATRCTLSAKPRFWSGPNPARVKCHGRLTATLPALALGVRWTFTFKARNAKGRTVTLRKTLALHKPPFAISSNWSGYVVPSAAPITSVSGDFTVPTLDCAVTKNAGEAAWVGTGGAGGSTGDLLQTGVVSECIGGVQVENPGWWEEYPQRPATLFNTIAMKVSPGDTIAASVAQNPDTTWTTRLDDLTTRVSGVMHTGDAWGTYPDIDPTAFTKEGDASTIAYSGGRSAEWIVEDYGTAGGLVPFADFGTVAFTNVATSVASWSLTPKEQVGLADKSGLLLAAPSAPDSTGKGFSVSYTG